MFMFEDSVGENSSTVAPTADDEIEENDVTDTQPGSASIADRLSQKTPYRYSLHFSWTKRQLTGLGFINFHRKNQTSPLLYRRSRLLIGGCKVPIRLDQTDGSSVRMTGLPSTATEEEIQDVVVRIVGEKGCIRDVALIREAAFETTETDLATIQKKLLGAVNSLCPEIKAGVIVRPPLPKDFRYFGFLRFSDSSAGVSAFNTLRDSLEIGGQAVTVTQHVHAKIFVNKDLKASLLPEIQQLRRETRKHLGKDTVEVTNSEDPAGNLCLNIASDSIDTVSRVWTMYNTFFSHKRSKQTKFLHQGAHTSDPTLTDTNLSHKPKRKTKTKHSNQQQLGDKSSDQEVRVSHRSTVVTDFSDELSTKTIMDLSDQDTHPDVSNIGSTKTRTRQSDEGPHVSDRSFTDANSFNKRLIGTETVLCNTAQTDVTSGAGGVLTLSWKRRNLTGYGKVICFSPESVKSLMPRRCKTILVDGHNVSLCFFPGKSYVVMERLPPTATDDSIMKAFGCSPLIKRIDLSQENEFETKQRDIDRMKSFFTRKIKKLCAGAVTIFSIVTPCPQDEFYTGHLQCAVSKDRYTVFNAIYNAIEFNGLLVKVDMPTQSSIGENSSTGASPADSEVRCPIAARSLQVGSENDTPDRQPEGASYIDLEGLTTPNIYSCTLHFSWTRRQLNGLGFINFLRPNHARALLHQRSQLYIGGCMAPIELNKKVANSVRIIGPPSTATEEEIQDAVVRVVGEKGCIRDVALIREAGFENTERELETLQEDLSVAVKSLCPEIQADIIVRRPFHKDFYYLGSARFSDSREGVSAFNNLRDSLEICGNNVTVTQQFSAELFVDKDLKPPLLPELQKLRRDIRKSPGIEKVQVADSEDSDGNLYLTIASDSIDTVSKVWTMYHSLMEEWAPNDEPVFER